MEHQKEYIAGLLEKLNHLEQDDTGLHSPESIHKLRLTIKKLNAFFDFLSACHHCRLPQMKQMRKAFKLAGKIRQLHLQIPVLEENIKTRNKQFRQLISRKQEQLARLTVKLDALYTKRYQKWTAKIARAVEKCLDRHFRAKPGNYFQVLADDIITGIFSRPTQTDEVHNLRKKIKILKYNLVLVPEVYKADLPAAALLDKWEQDIGNWHDTMDLIEQLDQQQYRQGKTLTAAVTAFQANLKTRSRKEYKQIMSAIDDLKTIYLSNIRLVTRSL